MVKLLILANHNPAAGEFFPNSLSDHECVSNIFTIVSACDLSSSVCSTIVPHFLHDFADSILPTDPLPILADDDQTIEILVLHIAFEETPRIMSAATGAPYFPGVRHLSHIHAGGFRLSPVHYHNWGHARDLCNSLRSCPCAILNMVEAL